MNFRDFLNVEIFSVGKWNDRNFTDADLDEIVNAYAATKGQLAIPLKIGHTDKPKALADDLPSVGWIENVRRSGSKLIADFKRVPDTVANLIEAGAYRGRSIELIPNAEYNETSYKFLLSGIALLGATLPAVSGLADIVALYSKEGIDHDKDAEFIIVFNKETEQPKEPVQVDLIAMAKLLDLPETATEEEIRAKVEELKKPPEDKPNNDEVFEANKRILALEQQLANTEASAAVDSAIRAGKLLPKQKEFALKMAMQDKEAFTAFINSQPENMIEFGEKGSSSEDGLNFSKYEPTETEISVAKQMNVWSNEWRIELMKRKARAEGVEIPANFGKEKVEA